jgi:hypothetical protein
MYDNFFLHSVFRNIDDPDDQDMLAGDNVSVTSLVLTVGKVCKNNSYKEEATLMMLSYY